MRSLVPVALMVTLAAGRAVSQQIPTPFTSNRTEVLSDAATPAQGAPEPTFGSPLLAAAGLGLLGWGLGAVTGYVMASDCFGDYCGFEGVFYGGAAGGGLGLAVGAHLGNRRRGNLVLDVLTSGVVWGLGYAAMTSFADDSDDTGLFLTAALLPPTQLVATVLVERASGRSRARRS